MNRRRFMQGLLATTALAAVGAAVATPLIKGHLGQWGGVKFIESMPFDSRPDEYAQFQIEFPKGWADGEVTIAGQWTPVDRVTWLS